MTYAEILNTIKNRMTENNINWIIGEIRGSQLRKIITKEESQELQDLAMDWWLWCTE